MLKNIIKKKRQQGFTIIEVMIVLAIAGLILVVVLVAVPQLQRNQRNSARQSILARISAEIGSYAGNNGGSLPAASTADAAGSFGATATPAQSNSFVGRYLASININDPSTGSSVDFVAEDGVITPPGQGIVRYVLSAECGADGAMTALPGQNRKYAIAIGLESGRAYCIDNK